MNISKKVISYILIGFLCVSSCSITYYKSVHAFEWVEVGISTAEALKWILGAFGIVATGSVAIDNFWNGYEDEFYEYASEENVSGPDVRAWLEKLAKGTLDKGSEVWDIFKSWASNLVTENSSGSSGADWSSGGTFTINDILNSTGINFRTDGANANRLNTSVSPIFAFYETDGNSSSCEIITGDSVAFSRSVDRFGNPIFIATVSNYVCYTFMTYSASNYTTGSSKTFSHNSSYSYNSYVYGFNGSFEVNGVLNWNIAGTSSVGSLDTINDARQEQFDLINRNTGNEVEQEVAIPMPGVSSGDDTISQDSYDAIMDRVESGEISIDDAISEIQEIMQVLVYDTETDDVIPISPDPEDPNENQKKDDVLKEEKENMGFTLAGLENVFPFCIPFDLYALLGILEAEPQAPVFQFPFRDPKTKRDIMYTVDLSVFNPVAVVTRYGADLLFIFGLAIATRKLIGAGGGD